MTDRFEAGDVRSYYDRHTKAFIAYGQGGDAGAIHRAVWGPGVQTRGEAFRYVENRILDLLAGLPDGGRDAHVVDLGCGVGSSLCYLAERLPIRGTGVTISPVQADQATRRIREAGLADRVQCLEGDFSALPPAVATADLVFAIESFVHGPDPTAFLDSCRHLIRPGGWLLICDDVRRPTTAAAAPRAIERFRQGWHVNTLIDREELTELATNAGFAHEETEDLTDYLELQRPRDRLISLMATTVGWIPAVATRYDNLLGGAALQQCLTRGWVGYDLAIYRRTAS